MTSVLHLEWNPLINPQIGILIQRTENLIVYDYQINFLLYKHVLHIGLAWPK